MQNILCKSTLNKPPLEGVTKCLGPRCEICSIIITGEKICVGNDTIFINSNMNCNSKNVIYLLICQCQKFYIGETADFRARVNLHHNQIQKDEYRKLFVSKHIFSCSRGKFSIAPICSSYENEAKRLTMENFFIKKFKPNLNK